MIRGVNGSGLDVTRTRSEHETRIRVGLCSGLFDTPTSDEPTEENEMLGADKNPIFSQSKLVQNQDDRQRINAGSTHTSEMANG